MLVRISKPSTSPAPGSFGLVQVGFDTIRDWVPGSSSRGGVRELFPSEVDIGAMEASNVPTASLRVCNMGHFEGDEHSGGLLLSKEMRCKGEVMDVWCDWVDNVDMMQRIGTKIASRRAGRFLESVLESWNGAAAKRCLLRRRLKRCRGEAGRTSIACSLPPIRTGVGKSESTPLISPPASAQHEIRDGLAATCHTYHTASLATHATASLAKGHIS